MTFAANLEIRFFYFLISAIHRGMRVILFLLQKSPDECLLIKRGKNRRNYKTGNWLLKILSKGLKWSYICVINIYYTACGLYVSLYIQMMRTGERYFLHMAEMDLKTATSAMEALVRISVSSCFKCLILCCHWMLIEIMVWEDSSVDCTVVIFEPRLKVLTQIGARLDLNSASKWAEIKPTLVDELQLCNGKYVMVKQYGYRLKRHVSFLGSLDARFHGDGMQDSWLLLRMGRKLCLDAAGNSGSYPGFHTRLRSTAMSRLVHAGHVPGSLTKKKVRTGWARGWIFSYCRISHRGPFPLEPILHLDAGNVLLQTPPLFARDISVLMQEIYSLRSLLSWRLDSRWR